MACHGCNATKKQPKGTSGGPPKSPIISAGSILFICLNVSDARSLVIYLQDIAEAASNVGSIYTIQSTQYFLIS